ncbi:hypothetical protein EBB07_29335 [Paenibacillaceae bacterium]|nr:hypothetical protein EBB07_29335 [Paenibacillaceae bacterium]
MKNVFENELNATLKGNAIELFRSMTDLSYAIEIIRDDDSLTEIEKICKIESLNNFKESIKSAIESSGIDLNELIHYNYQLLKQTV